MTQLSLFAPTPCPCGLGPYIHEESDGWEIGLWCNCPEILILLAPTLPEVLAEWEGYLAERVAA